MHSVLHLGRVFRLLMTVGVCVCVRVTCFERKGFTHCCRKCRFGTFRHSHRCDRDSQSSNQLMAALVVYASMRGKGWHANRLDVTGGTCLDEKNLALGIQASVQSGYWNSNCGHGDDDEAEQGVTLQRCQWTKKLMQRRRAVRPF